MLNKLRIEESQVPRMCLDLYREYGTTMAGLKVSELLGFGGASVLFRVVWIVVIVCSCRVLRLRGAIGFGVRFRLRRLPRLRARDAAVREGEA